MGWSPARLQQWHVNNFFMKIFSANYYMAKFCFPNRLKWKCKHFTSIRCSDNIDKVVVAVVVVVTMIVVVAIVVVELVVAVVVIAVVMAAVVVVMVVVVAIAAAHLFRDASLKL